jgi:hypothetical protein
VTSFQVVPPSAEYWKSTVPEGPAGMSDPGAVTETVALSPMGCPDTETPGVAVIDVEVPAGPTASVALGEVDMPKFGSPE